jgi:hypothetical protein
MADKFKKTLPVRIRFSDGEVITGAKLNTVMSSLERSLYLLEKAIGDLDDQSYPYFASADTLSQASGRNSSEGVVGSDRKLEIANLARLVGPASALNPIHITDVSYAETEVTETVPSTGNVFVFKYVPNTATTAPAFSDAAVFQTFVASSALNAAGEYCITSTGEVYTYSTMNGGTVTYYADVGMENTGDAMADPTWSTYNVIPDQNQTVKCTAVGPTSGLYTITLPTATHSVVDDAGSDQTLGVSDLSYGVRLRLPMVLQDLVSGTEIPEGFLYLRDDDTGVTYKDAQYYSYNTYEFKIGGVTLDTSHRFTVLTIGSNITETLLDLKLKLWKLRRGRDDNALFPASQLVKGIGAGRKEIYGPSEVPYNFFPQYLHRDGWFDSDDDSNKNHQNGMRGDLVLLSTSTTNRIGFGADSHRLRFSDPVNGASIYFDEVSAGLDALVFDSGTDVDWFKFSGAPLRADNGFSIGTAVTGGPLKWLLLEDSFTLSSGLGEVPIPTLAGKTVYGVTFLIQFLDVWFTGGTIPFAGSDYGFTHGWDSVDNKIYVEVNTAIWGASSTLNYKTAILYTE